MRTPRSLSVPRAAFGPEMTRRLPSLIGSPSAISTQPNSSASHASEALSPPVSPPSEPPPSLSSAHAAAINMRANRSDNRDNHFDLLMNPPYSTDEPHPDTGRHPPFRGAEWIRASPKCRLSYRCDLPSPTHSI